MLAAVRVRVTPATSHPRRSARGRRRTVAAARRRREDRVHVVDHGLRAGRRRRSRTASRSTATRSPSSTSDADAFRRLGPGSRGRTVTGVGLRPGHPARGRHRAGRRVRRGQQRRQLQHHRRPGGPRDVRRRERRRPHLRPPPRRGLPAAGHPHGRHRRWTADQMLRRLLPEGAEPQWRDPTGQRPARRGARRRGLDRPARSPSSRRRPAPGSRSCTRLGEAVLPDAPTPSSRRATSCT